MITLNGTLRVRSIYGRNGRFNVADLVTEIGEFKVKDAFLDQFEEGAYDGAFQIGRIFAASYTNGGRITIETRAHVLGVRLHNDQVGQLPTEVVEPDPIEEAQPNPEPVAGITAQADTAEAIDPAPTAVEHEEEDPDKLLFGHIYPLGGTVALDPTVDRARFRRQRDRLKELGYRFEPLQQSGIMTA
jgi:hypothetical protein